MVAMNSNPIFRCGPALDKRDIAKMLAALEEGRTVNVVCDAMCTVTVDVGKANTPLANGDTIIAGALRTS